MATDWVCRDDRYVRRDKFEKALHAAVQDGMLPPDVITEDHRQARLNKLGAVAAWGGTHATGATAVP
jgi:hypothetical protein